MPYGLESAGTRGLSPRHRQEVRDVGYNFGVGREAPTFTLSAADGNEIALAQYRGDWLPVLVFLPAADPGAGAALTGLSAAADTLWGLRGQLLGVCDAGVDALRDLAASTEGLSFPLLADDGTVARAYGALKPDGALRPMVFVVDRAGKIVWSGEGAEALVPEAIVAAFRQVVR
jgi:peroxiredoxin Q/BCP